MIIFDLDGTLADCEHRRHFVQNPQQFEYQRKTPQTIERIETECYKKFKPDWQAFYEACDQDKPIQPVIEIFRNQMNLTKRLEDEMGWNIWSGRDESVRDKTIAWLVRHVSPNFELKKYQNSLKMRPSGDNTPDDVLKEKWLDELICSQSIGWGYMRHPVDYVFDDRPKVVRMWRRRGIFVFNCLQNEGEF